MAIAALSSGCGPAAPPAAPAPAVTPASSTSAAPAAVSADDPGFGRHHHAIRTTNAEAQRAFDRGFDFVFGFNHEEAAKAFAKAAELDPSAAMPLWGVAWAIGPNYNLDIDDARSKQAYDAMQKAVALAKDGPPEERAYVEAMAVRFSPDPKADRVALARQYSDRMRAVTQAFPDDLDAATLYAESLMNLKAWKLWTLDGKPADRTEEIVRVLEGVLARDPSHLGANHYYIHTVEASPTPARALASADRLRTLAPMAGHLVHMPAHILARTGDHEGAAKANLAGAEADRAFLAGRPDDNFYGMAYYTHNLHFLADSEMMQGRYAEATKAAADLTARHLRSVARRVEFLVRDGVPRPALAELMTQIATGIRLLNEELDDPQLAGASRSLVGDLARRLDPAGVMPDAHVTDAALVLMLRPLTVDLLAGSGMPIDEARELLPEL